MPTAVPPWANLDISGIFYLILLIQLLICWLYPENYWPREIGVASCVWVLPILITFLNYYIFIKTIITFVLKIEVKVYKDGKSLLFIYKTVEICIAVGKLSLLDCPILTSLFGCIFIFSEFRSVFPLFDIT